MQNPDICISINETEGDELSHFLNESNNNNSHFRLAKRESGGQWCCRPLSLFLPIYLILVLQLSICGAFAYGVLYSPLAKQGQEIIQKTYSVTKDFNATQFRQSVHDVEKEVIPTFYRALPLVDDITNKGFPVVHNFSVQDFQNALYNVEHRIIPAVDDALPTLYKLPQFINESEQVIAEVKKLLGKK